MDSSEEERTGSADSENGSDNSYVQVSKEDIQQESLQEDQPEKFQFPAQEAEEEVEPQENEAKELPITPDFPVQVRETVTLNQPLLYK